MTSGDDASGPDQTPMRPRRRRRASAAAGPPTSARPTVDEPQPAAPAAPARAAGPRDGASRGSRATRRPRTDGAERGLRELVGAGPSQLGLSKALRGRDVDRPSDADLEAAERDLVIVRRNWKPPE